MDVVDFLKKYGALIRTWSFCILSYSLHQDLRQQGRRENKIMEK